MEYNIINQKFISGIESKFLNLNSIKVLVSTMSSFLFTDDDNFLTGINFQENCSVFNLSLRSGPKIRSTQPLKIKTGKYSSFLLLVHYFGSNSRIVKNVKN